MISELSLPPEQRSDMTTSQPALPRRAVWVAALAAAVLALPVFAAPARAAAPGDPATASAFDLTSGPDLTAMSPP
jgi:hypothetical protein